MKRYTVYATVTQRFTVEIDAEDGDDAIKKGEYEIYNAIGRVEMDFITSEHDIHADEPEIQDIWTGEEEERRKAYEVKK